MTNPELFSYNIDDMSLLDLKKVIAQLRTHQSEIEEQNGELHAIQDQLSDTRDKYQLLFDQAPVAYLTLDEDGVIIENNITFSTFFYHNPLPIIGTLLTDLIDPAYQDTFYRYQLKQKQNPNYQPVQIKLRSGFTKGNFVQLSSRFTHSNERWIWCVTLLDNTQNVLLEEKLRHSNKRLEKLIEDKAKDYKKSRDEIKSILDSVADAILTIDKYGNINSCNQAACDMFNISNQDLIKLNLKNLLPTMDETSLLVSLNNARRKPVQPISRSEHKGQRLDKELFPLDILITRIDTLDLFTCVLRDISEIKSLQKTVLQATEAERNRISRDLHDSLGQSMTGISMLAKSISEKPRQDEAITSTLFLNMSQDLDHCIAELRQIVQDLSPLDLQDQGLVNALKKLIKSTEAQHPIHCSLEADTFIQIKSIEPQVQLLRITQEAIQNAIKHSNASNISVLIRCDDKELELTISDNGDGFCLDATTIQGLGLKTMKFRANTLGGTLFIDSHQGNGTRVQCKVPWPGEK